MNLARNGLAAALLLVAAALAVPAQAAHPTAAECLPLADAAEAAMAARQAGAERPVTAAGNATKLVDVAYRTAVASKDPYKARAVSEFRGAVMDVCLNSQLR